MTVTDGEENASREYAVDRVRKLFTQQADAYGWEFVFLGPNQDAVLAARTMGINAGAAMTCASSASAARGMSGSLSRYTTDVRRKQKRAFSSDERR